MTVGTSTCAGEVVEPTSIFEKTESSLLTRSPSSRREHAKSAGEPVLNPSSEDPEKLLFDEASLVCVETTLLGFNRLSAPPEHATRCWLHSLDSSQHTYWVRLQCYALGAVPTTQALLWVLVTVVPVEGVGHPLMDFYNKLVRDRELYRSRSPAR